MILLDSTSDLIQLITDAASDIEVHESHVDHNAGTYTPASDNVPSITTATTTTIVGSPGASTQRSVRHLNIRNNHASTACTVTIQHTDGTDTTVLYKTVLAAGESIVFTESGVWVYYDPNGKPYMGIGPFASQADMEAGSSLVTIVSPGRMQFHPGVAKFWVEAGVTGNILTSYNVTSLTDTGTGVMAVTIATDFSTANWCCLVMGEATGTTWAVANSREFHIRNATIASGSVSVDCIDNTTTTNLVKDPTTWHVMGFGDQA